MSACTIVPITPRPTFAALKATRALIPVFTCAIIGHEHADQAEAQQCVAWLYDNWDELSPTGLPVRAEWLELWSAKTDA